MSEEKIVRMFSSDADSAMENFYAVYSGYLAGICSRYIQDSDRRKDILQESLIKIFTQIGRFRYMGEGSLKAWAARITVNEALQELRREGRSPLSRMSEGMDLPSEDSLGDSERLCKGLDLDKVDAGTLSDMISRLPAGYRSVFNLYAIEGKSHKEIADILGIRPDTSASQYHRAKALLARWLSDYLKKKENE